MENFMKMPQCETLVSYWGISFYENVIMCSETIHIYRKYVKYLTKLNVYYWIHVQLLCICKGSGVRKHMYGKLAYKLRIYVLDKEVIDLDI